MIKDSYADVTVINSSRGQGHIGGFAGYVWMATVENCYSNGPVIQKSSGATEGLIGWDSNETIISSYGDTERSGIPVDYFSLGTGLTTEQMKQQSSYQGWDFTNVWGIDQNINNGYPYLRAFHDNN